MTQSKENHLLTVKVLNIGQFGPKTTIILIRFFFPLLIHHQSAPETVSNRCVYYNIVTVIISVKYIHNVPQICKTPVLVSYM